MKKITPTAEQTPVANLSLTHIGKVFAFPEVGRARLVAFSAIAPEEIRVMLLDPDAAFHPDDLLDRAVPLFLSPDVQLTHCKETDGIEVTAGELHAGHVGLTCLSLMGRTNGDNFQNQYRTVDAVRHGVRKGEAVIDFGGIPGPARVNNDAVLTLLQTNDAKEG